MWASERILFGYTGNRKRLPVRAAEDRHLSAKRQDPALDGQRERRVNLGLQGIGHRERDAPGVESYSPIGQSEVTVTDATGHRQRSTVRAPTQLTDSDLIARKQQTALEVGHDQLRTGDPEVRVSKVEMSAELWSSRCSADLGAQESRARRFHLRHERFDHPQVNATFDPQIESGVLTQLGASPNQKLLAFSTPFPILHLHPAATQIKTGGARRLHPEPGHRELGVLQHRVRVHAGDRQRAQSDCERARRPAAHLAERRRGHPGRQHRRGQRVEPGGEASFTRDGRHRTEHPVRQPVGKERQRQPSVDVDGGALPRSLDCRDVDCAIAIRRDQGDPGHRRKVAESDLPVREAHVGFKGRLLQRPAHAYRRAHGAVNRGLEGRFERSEHRCRSGDVCRGTLNRGAENPARFASDATADSHDGTANLEGEIIRPKAVLRIRGAPDAGGSQRNIGHRTIQTTQIQRDVRVRQAIDLTFDMSCDSHDASHVRRRRNLEPRAQSGEVRVSHVEVRDKCPERIEIQRDATAQEHVRHPDER